ncbi:MAG: phosphoribosylglycinamide formyltransferase [Flavobacteriales bacterium]|nr:phosphoribosylglycinamide formyltransferase [Flavobacteriales bacterium]
MTKHRIAIFASGAGSNANRIMEYFKNSENISVDLIICNNPEAGVLIHAINHKVRFYLGNNAELSDPTLLMNLLSECEINFIVLAGYLRKIPLEVIQRFPNKIINIHPALLPKYGGKGMYGSRVHQAVLDNNEHESGITIHYVTEHYDEGGIIAQFNCPVLEKDTVDALAKRIHELEHKNYPEVLANLLL